MAAREEDLWSIEISFLNKNHAEKSLVKFDPVPCTGKETLESLIWPRMMEELERLRFPGFGLWAQHEAVHPYTILDELNYQRKERVLRLECHDHNCQYRAILVPRVFDDECLACLEPLTQENRVTPLCFHSSMCKKCWQGVDACPKCRKPKNKSQKSL